VTGTGNEGQEKSGEGRRGRGRIWDMLPSAKWIEVPESMSINSQKLVI